MLGVLKVANRLSYNDLLKYMEIVLDMEKNVYIEEQTWKYLNNQANNLGIKKIYKEPKKSNVDTSGCGSFIGCGTVMGIAATGLTVLHSTCTSSCLAPLEEGFWNKPITIGVSVFLICLVIILIMFLAEKKDKDNQYEQDMKKYKKNMENDRVRVERELKQKRYIQTQCNTLAQMYQKSRNALDTIYSYDILEMKYRNIVAVSSIYEYLKYDRTRSLQRVGSDEGAYNMFETEMRLNKIITNTDVIIKKLDKIMENQRELAYTMRNAQNSINTLINSTNQIQGSLDTLNTGVELSNYQLRQANNELRYMNFMNTLRFYI